jgi:hypothetical protein
MPQANVNSPFGFKPLKSPSGTVRVNSYSDYSIANAYNTAIPYQAVVSKSGTGTNIIAGADGTAAKVGVFLGCKYRDTLGNFIFSKNWLASTPTFNSEGAQAIVADDPKQVFLARMSGALTADNIGQFAGMVVGAANTVGVSTSAVNSSDITGTADVFKILELYNDGLNAYGNYSLVKVMLGIHEYNGPAAS